MDRKHAKVILDNIDVIKAFVNGETVQYRYEGFKDWRDTDTPHFSPSIEYRVKPDAATISFRRYLWEDSNGRIRLSLWEDLDGYSTVTKHAVETRSNFVKWVDNETQTDDFFL